MFLHYKNVSGINKINLQLIITTLTPHAKSRHTQGNILYFGLTSNRRDGKMLMGHNIITSRSDCILKIDT